MPVVVPHTILPIARSAGGYQGIITNLTTGTPSLTPGTTQTSGAGVDTLTASFTDLITAANMLFDVGYMELIIGNNNASATDTSTLLNLYLGAAAAEVLFIQHIAAGWVGAHTVGPNAIMKGFPCFIPAGTRLSMKSQAITSARACQVLVYLYPAIGRSGSKYRGATKFQTIGTVSTGSRGTSHTPGNTGAFSTEADYGSALTFDARWITLQAHGQGSKADTTMTNVSYQVQVRDTADANRVYGEWWVGNNAAETQAIYPARMLPCYIPRGTTLALRAKCSGTAEAQDYSIIVAA